MILKTEYDTKVKIYSNYLEQIGNVRFTQREIDIIACILHNRGEKKIASILSISPRTVSVHNYNIMSKLGYNSRDYIIDFIEKSGKLEHCKQYYLYLLRDAYFERCLQKIAKLHSGALVCITKQDMTSSEEALICIIGKHLKLANIILSTKKNDVTSDSEKNGELLYNLVLQKEDYYLAILDFLEQIIHDDQIPAFVIEFKNEYKALDNSWKKLETKKVTFNYSEGKFWSQNKILIGTICFIIFIGACFKLKKINDQDKLIAELDTFLLQSNNVFSDNNVDEKSAYINYELAKKLETIILNIDEDKIRNYFINNTSSLLNYLYNLLGLANYYRYYEHDGDKSHEVIQNALEIINEKIHSKKIAVSNLSIKYAEEIYSETSVIKDLPQIYTRLVYALGRGYMYGDRKNKAVQYFELSEYLGNKLGLFEGHLSYVNGIGILNLFEVNQNLKDKNYDGAKSLIIKSIDLYHASKANNQQYIISYVPRSKNHNMIIPGKDVHNNAECRKRLTQFYVKLLEVEKLQSSSDYDQKKYILKISDQFLDGKNSILSIIEDLPRKKQADLYNFLGNLLLKLEDMDFPSDLLDTFILNISNKLKLKKQDNLDLIIKLFNHGIDRSRDIYFTKADSYDGLVRAYERKLIKGKITNDQLNNKEISEKIKKCKIERDSVNQKLGRKNQNIFE